MKSARQIPGVSSQRIKGGGGNETRVLVMEGKSAVKVETSPVTRGVILEPKVVRVQPRVEKDFGFAEAVLVSFEDAYAGKLHATLSRQHPRDSPSRPLSLANSSPLSLRKSSLVNNCLLARSGPSDSM